jgi:NADH-quinone oxidoreductase subunit M
VFLIAFFSIFSSSFYYFILRFFILVFFLTASSYYSSSYFFSSFFCDEVSFFITFMLLIVMFFSVFWTVRFSKVVFSLFLFFVMLLVCYMVFSSSSLFFLYMGYELSLIPIVLIIVFWGSYPERSLRSIMLLLYTSVFTIPFMYVLWFFYCRFFSFNFYLRQSIFRVFNSFPSWFSILFFLVFVVKLPVYGLHFWLPMAHVEAPTFGSMILAGVLLKLGGVGLIRCFSFMDWSFLYAFSAGYLVVFLAYVPLVCAFQSDFKRLVAYSSVSHIMVVPLMLLTFSSLSLKGLILVLLFHGLSSPLLFSMVGYSYSLYSTRQMVFMRGLFTLAPLLSFIFILAFFFTLCVPPFPSFVSEVLFFFSSFRV